MSNVLKYLSVILFYIWASVIGDFYVDLATQFTFSCSDWETTA